MHLILLLLLTCTPVGCPGGCQVIDIPNSMTVLPELIPLSIQMVSGELIIRCSNSSARSFHSDWPVHAAAEMHLTSATHPHTMAGALLQVVHYCK